jgi:hypothetical protein
MRTPKKTSTESKTSGFVIGRERFLKISAVEGIKPSEAMTKRAREFDRKALSAEQRGEAIIRAHRKD